MARVLELAQLTQHDRVTEMDVGRRRVDAELDPQLPALGRAACSLPRQRPLGQAVDRVVRERRAASLGGRVSAFGIEGQC